MTVTAQDVVKKLHTYYEARDRLKEIRLELAKLSVELGQDQRDAMNGGAADYLDGYCAACGMLPDYRK